MGKRRGDVCEVNMQKRLVEPLFLSGVALLVSGGRQSANQAVVERDVDCVAISEEEDRWELAHHIFVKMEQLERYTFRFFIDISAQFDTRGIIERNADRGICWEAPFRCIETCSSEKSLE